jgi:hypothetical protein
MSACIPGTLSAVQGSLQQHLAHRFQASGYQLALTRQGLLYSLNADDNGLCSTLLHLLLDSNFLGTHVKHGPNCGGWWHRAFFGHSGGAFVAKRIESRQGALSAAEGGHV